MTKNNQNSNQFSTWLGDTQNETESMDTHDRKLIDALDATFASGPDDEAVEAAAVHLEERLKSELKSAVYYDILPDSPIGDVFIARNNMGLIAVDMQIAEDEFINRLAAEMGGAPVHAPEELVDALQQMREYFNGERQEFELPVDLSRLTEFQRQVLAATNEVPAGQLATYGEIAERAGSPRASRAAGQALARNPVPIVIPCHRVIASDGSLTGYSGGGGVETKAQLLQFEGAML